MALNVPPPGTRGLYSLKAPFTTVPNQLYSCGAIRFFKDLQNQGINVYEKYYQPLNLTESDYSRDLAAGVAIISLLSDSQAPVYVPSSYILAYPGLTSYNYQYVVLSIALGALPDSLDLTFLKTQLATTASEVVGVLPTVFENIAPATGVVTPEQHDAMEAARQAAISNRTTDRALYLVERDKRIALEAKLAALEQLVIDKGLLT
ncbi:hypothetical protein FDI21_gp174 [Pseudomonas phage Noxifer]|uniref:Uncharacterized protein n=1 Tax=Pseudomonas phage Noxifer TaxID=2006684 RepID=A0A1Y0SZX7_9CAUD|nr:hypothetical protein FDI21_gp174 [Pseudomonas phage Noxifer]ARV77343.1 hypothetical protein NOXIFER_174 [Pseudomonas phage Noxifer]